jgi:hypothetical protein
VAVLTPVDAAAAPARDHEAVFLLVGAHEKAHKSGPIAVREAFLGF